MLELPPLSLYVHVPWCVRKCPYCDFNSHEHDGDLPEAEYIEALCADFDANLPALAGRELESIFIGGGTPSLFSAGAFEQLLQYINRHVNFSPSIEITLEANPGTAEAARFRDYRSLGINRLSLGIQSFADTQLKRLGRIHDSAQARRAIDLARAAGFDNFNLDLMHGLPEQSVTEAMADLDTALAFAPPHLSWYQLTIEPNTVFYSRPPPLPAEPVLESLQVEGLARLADAGLVRYEVSAYSLAGRQSTHNLNYWRFGDYIGIGAGAHGKLTQPEADEILRTRAHRQPRHYLAATASRQAERKAVTGDERPLEFLLNALRLVEGFSEAQFAARTGLPFSRIAKQVECLTKTGLLSHTDGRVTTTDKGYSLLNSVLEEFL